MSRRHYTAEFKQEAVRVFRTSGKPLTYVAQDLGIPLTTLKAWVDSSTREPEAGAPSDDERRELRRLRRELETVKMERDFLKKAAAFFAKESK